MLQPKEILERKIDELDFSYPFKTQCHEMGFEYLKDVCQTTSADMIQRNGFTYDWLIELTDFLQCHQLLDVLQSTPGKTVFQSYKPSP